MLRRFMRGSWLSPSGPEQQLQEALGETLGAAIDEARREWLGQSLATKIPRMGGFAAITRREV